MPTGRTRNISSIVNRTNNCGGIKKAGLAPRTGGNALVMRNIATQAVNTIPTVKCGSGGRGCPRNFSNNPGGQACGGVGRMAKLASRGIAASAPTSTVPAGPITITLATALTQNGVASNQNLMLQQNDFDTDNSGNVVGLRIRTGQTFTVATGGAITFADPIVSTNGDAIGIHVENGATFNLEGDNSNTQSGNSTRSVTRNVGGAITSGIIFDRNISAANTARGVVIESGGSFRISGGMFFRNLESNNTGISSTPGIAVGIANSGEFIYHGNGFITFSGIIENNVNARGIFNNSGARFVQEGGTIVFQRDITGASATGIENQGEFLQQGGNIIFAGNIVSPTSLITDNSITRNATGINNFGSGTSFTQHNRGTITFEQDINNEDGDAFGIFNNSAVCRPGGKITFEGEILSTATATGISDSDNIPNAPIGGGQFEQTAGGIITFEGGINGTTAARGIFNSTEAFIQSGRSSNMPAGKMIFSGLLQQNGTASGAKLLDIAGNLIVDGSIEFSGTSGTYNANNFNPNPVNNSITGTGSITYNTGAVTYYGTPRVIITLATARAQNGVQQNETLILRESDYVLDNNDLYGLRINNGETFNVTGDGTIIFADPISSQNNAFGIGIFGTVRLEGFITFEGNISSINGDAKGIFNGFGGNLTQAGGAITFNDAIMGAQLHGKAYGIFIHSGSTFTQRGARFNDPGSQIPSGNSAITFSAIGGDGLPINNNVITTPHVTDTAIGIFNNGTFTQASADIFFQQNLTGRSTAIGIQNNNNRQFILADNSSIIFNNEIQSENSTFGIFNSGINILQETTSEIMFKKPLISSSGNIKLINHTNTGSGTFQVNGTIQFFAPIDGASTYGRPTNFNPNPVNNTITGTGSISIRLHPRLPGVEFYYTQQ